MLILWDAIFADEAGFQLVDFLFVAMLEFLRDYLLASDYTTCMRVLMKFPAVGDAAWFIKKAYNLRDPFSHPRPSNFSYSNILAKRAKMAKQLNSGSGDGGANNNNRSATGPSSILTMVAGKQAHRNSETNGSAHHPHSMSRDISKSSLSEDHPAKSHHASGGMSASSSVSSAISDGLSRFMTPAGSEVVLGTSTTTTAPTTMAPTTTTTANDDDVASTALFSATQPPRSTVHRQRATSEGVPASLASKMGKKSAGIAHRLTSRVSTAEEALPDGEEAAPVEMLPAVAESEMAALRTEVASATNRVHDLEAKVDDMGALIQTTCVKLSWLAKELDASTAPRPPAEAAKELLQIRKQLLECLKLSGQAKAAAMAEQVDEEAATITNGVHGQVIRLGGEEIQAGTADCLDDAAREALQSALMEEAVEATEPTQPVETPRAANAAASKGRKAESLGAAGHSPMSDSSDYSMVDANDEYIVDIVEGLEKKL